MHVHWTERAEEDLMGIVAYIAARNVSAAQRLESALLDTVERITQFPDLYRPGRVTGTREAVVTPNYIVVYAVADDYILVQTILHARQQYP